MSRPFAVVGFSFLFTCAFLFFLPDWALYVALAVFAAGFALALALRQKGAVPAALASAALACLLMLVQLGQAYYPALQSAYNSVEIRAVITGDADAQYGRYYYPLQTVSIEGQKKKLKLRLSSKYPIYAAPYDEIAFTGSIFSLGGDDPDMALNYRARGIYLGVYPDSFEEDRYEVTPRNSMHPMRAVLLFRRYLQNQLQSIYPDDAAALLRGMLLGDKTGLRWAVEQDFRVAGISHLFSVSGLQMSILAWSFFKALLALKCKRKPAALCGAVFVLFFMALTGFSSSCVRAGLMMLVLLAGELFSRKADSLNSLGFAALVLCAASPLSAGQIGLQLSFGAVLGIVLFADRLSAPFKKCKLKFLMEPLCVTASVMVLYLPISLLRLPGGISLMCFPANVLTVPLAGPALILAGLSALLPLKIFVYPARLLAQLIISGAHFLAGLPAPVLRGDVKTLAIPIALCAMTAAIALILRYAGKPVKLRYTAAAVCVCMLLGGWLPGFITRNEINVERLDTGQGISYLVSQGNRAALLGCGGDKLPAGSAKRALSTLGARELQLLLIPGASKALSAGKAELIRDIPAARLIDAAETPPGFTNFSLWDGLAGILYLDGAGGAACLLEWSGEVLQFGGENPWRYSTNPP